MKYSGKCWQCQINILLFSAIFFSYTVFSHIVSQCQSYVMFYSLKSIVILEGLWWYILFFSLINLSFSSSSFITSHLHQSSFSVFVRFFSYTNNFYFYSCFFSFTQWRFSCYPILCSSHFLTCHGHSNYP